MTADRDKWMMHSQNLLVSDTVHHIKQSPLSMSGDTHTHTLAEATSRECNQRSLQPLM